MNSPLARKYKITARTNWILKLNQARKGVRIIPIAATDSSVLMKIRFPSFDKRYRIKQNK